MHDSFNHLDYKADNRTEKELYKDLKKGITNECLAIRKFKSILLKTDIENPHILYVGSDDAEGKIVVGKDKSIADIDLFPDYLLKYKKQKRIQFSFIEVKICNPTSDHAFFKVRQLQQFRDLGSVVILFIMGYKTNNPRFALIEPESILDLGIEPVVVFGKETIVVPVESFHWDDFAVQDRRNENLLNKKYLK